MEDMVLYLVLVERERGRVQIDVIVDVQAVYGDMGRSDGTTMRENDNGLFSLCLRCGFYILDGFGDSRDQLWESFA